MATLDEHARAGIQAINEQRFSDAIDSFTAALEIEPDRPDMNNALGMAYLHRGDAGNAISYLERACELAEPFTDPHADEMRRHFHIGLATAYQLLDRVADARGVLERMVERWPEHTEQRLQLAQLLLSSCSYDDGVEVYKRAIPLLDKDNQDAANALVGAVQAFVEADHPPDVFIQAHRDSYVNYFDEVTSDPATDGWYTEAARMARGPDGEPVAIVADGARPYALSRVDIVNPQTGEVGGVYSEQEPMIVAVEGLEPLAQMAVMFPWDGGFPFEAWVCTRAPWHWLPIIVQFEDAAEPEELGKQLDDLIGEWYLAGFNGEYGEADSGRFHYVTDPDPIGDRAIAYHFDLGRARYDAIPQLLRRLTMLHTRQPVKRVLFGQGRLPD